MENRPAPANTRPFEVNGLKFLARLGEKGRDSADVQVVTEVVGDDCYGLRFLKPAIDALPDGGAPAIFDVGGNVGAFGTLALSLWPQGKLLAFEPWPENADLYERHLADNGLKGAVERAAVKYTGLGDLVLVTFPGHEGLTAVMGADDADKLANADKIVARVPVAATTLEAAADRAGAGRINLVKMDCEYGEWDILRHADPALWPRVDFMVGEFHGSAEKFAKLLSATFPGRPTATVAAFPTLGQFWVGPAGADGVLAAAESAFLRYLYTSARREADGWRERFMRIFGRFPLKQLYAGYRRLRGYDNFYLFDAGPMELFPDQDL